MTAVASVQEDEGRQGPYMLSGPVDRPAVGVLPVRGDLAHIALAGRHFVPSYVVPQPRRTACAAALRLQPDGAAPALLQLEADAAIDVLDCAGDWAWACCGADGPAGYLPLDALV